MRRQPSRARVNKAWIIGALCLLVGGCGGGVALIGALTSGVGGLLTGALVSSAIKVRRVRIKPENPTLPVGGKVKFTAEAISILGNEIPAKDFDWRVDNANIGRIDSHGVFEAISEGTVVVSVNVVSLGSATGSTTVTVSNSVGGTVVTLSLYPSEITLPVGVTLPMVAVANGADGFPQPVPGLAWGVPTGSDVGTVDSNGLFTAQKAGEAIVQATVGGLADTSTITVKDGITPGALAAIYVLPPATLLPTGSTFTFHAYGLDQNGNYIGLSNVQWSVSGDIGTIGANGQLTAANESKDGQVIAKIDGFDFQGVALVNVRQP